MSKQGGKISKIYTSDWLGSETIYYNESNSKVSHNINEVIDYGYFDWDREGLANYFEFGYSVFGQTPIKNIKFLLPNQKLTITKNGKIQVKNLKDPIENWYGKVSDEEEVIEKIKLRVNEKVSGHKKVILPFSGGNDSRLIAGVVKDKSKFIAYTYGLSNKQNKSFEIVNAKSICGLFGIDWKQIKLGEFHRYLDDWYDIFGVSTHAHGMYQYEFYKNIRKIIEPGTLAINGLAGDAWAGQKELVKIDKMENLADIGMTYGLCADKGELNFDYRKNQDLKNDFWNKNKYKINDIFYQTVQRIRFKIILLSLLNKVPRSLGYVPWTPYTDIEIALGMLTLPESRRSNRLWQKEYFDRIGMGLNDIIRKRDYTNNLNHQGMLKDPLGPLNSSLLKEIVSEKYVDYINSNVLITPKSRTKYRLKSISQKYLKPNNRLRAKIESKEFSQSVYGAYLTLYPLQKLIEKRESC